MNVNVIDTVAGFDALEPGWSSLLESYRYRDVLYSHKWFSNWLRSFAAEKRLLVVGTEESGKLLSVLPLYEDTVHYCRIPVPVVKSMTNSHSNRFDMLAADMDSGELLAKSISAAFAGGKREIIVLDYVPENSYIMKWLSDVSREMRWKWTVSDYCTNSLVKCASDFSEFYGSLDGKFRRNVNAAQRKALARGDLVLQSLTDKEQLRDFLDHGFSLEASGWKGAEGTAIANSIPTRRFYEGIASDFEERGWLKLYLLRNQGDDLAFLFCVAGYGVMRALKIGVNEPLRHLGPGMLITKEVLSRLHDSGETSIWDFCGGEARWKRDWGNSSERLFRVVICNDTVAGNFLHNLRMSFVKVRELFVDDDKPLQTG